MAKSAHPWDGLPKPEVERLRKRTDAFMDRAEKAYLAGRTDIAARNYRAALKIVPWYSPGHYDLGLVYKYARRWKPSLAANLAAIERDPENKGAMWNAAIAATGLKDWKMARAMWKRYGIEMPGRSGPPVGRFGAAVVRLNPEYEGAETVWVRRIDPARAYITNVPLPESGYRFGDLVLHDGAPQGHRTAGGRKYSVFNALQRLERSPRKTYAADVIAPSRADADALESLATQREIKVEDWTRNLQAICLRCSYGMKHVHKARAKSRAKWTPGHSIGIAAHSAREARSLLQEWLAQDPARRLEAFYSSAAPVNRGKARPAWWNYEAALEGPAGKKARKARKGKKAR